MSRNNTGLQSLAELVLVFKTDEWKGAKSPSSSGGHLHEWNNLYGNLNY